MCKFNRFSMKQFEKRYQNARCLQCNRKIMKISSFGFIIEPVFFTIQSHSWIYTFYGKNSLYAFYFLLFSKVKKIHSIFNVYKYILIFFLLEYLYSFSYFKRIYVLHFIILYYIILNISIIERLLLIILIISYKKLI